MMMICIIIHYFIFFTKTYCAVLYVALNRQLTVVTHQLTEVIVSGVKHRCGVQLQVLHSVLCCSWQGDAAWTARGEVLLSSGGHSGFMGPLDTPMGSPVMSSEDDTKMQVGICRDTMTDTEKSEAAFRLFL